MKNDPQFCHLQQSLALKSSSVHEEEAMNNMIDTQIDRQKRISSQIYEDDDERKSKLLEQERHLKHQQRVFDELAPVFASGEETMTEELLPVYQDFGRRMIAAVTRNRQAEEEYRILDVACGSGALWPFLYDAARKAKQDRLSVVGVDLSSTMIESARILGEQLQDEHASFTAVASGIEEYCATFADNNNTPLFDIAILNACYGNFWDPPAVLAALCPLVQQSSGAILISHPLSASFVAQLHEADPMTVPHVLPVSEEEWKLQLARHCLPLRWVRQDHEKKNDDAPSLPYFTTLERTRVCTLPQVIRLQGMVDRGYGRGGKKLGFPTANLPSRLFQGALEQVPAGVYWGWARIVTLDTSEERDTNNVFKAVVNVGYSPTFEGNENPEKIVEAHLMVDDNPEETGASSQVESLLPSEFYGEPMQLLLVGFLRSEQKFPSFPDLVAQIHQDADDTKIVLEEELYKQFRNDRLFTTGQWVGKSGGDSAASWEFEDIADALDAVI